MVSSPLVRGLTYFTSQDRVSNEARLELRRGRLGGSLATLFVFVADELRFHQEKGTRGGTPTLTPYLIRQPEPFRFSRELMGGKRDFSGKP